MKAALPWAVLAAGAALALTGLGWMWTGLDIVQVERGWSGVIAGATMLGSGVLAGAVAALLFRLDDLIGALESAPTRGEQAREASPPPRPEPQETSPVETPAAEASAAKAPPPNPPDAPSEIVGRHVAGDTTYVMFADGSIEAHTPEGLKRYKSLDELRVHATAQETRGE